MIADTLLASGLNRLFAQTPGARDLLAKHAGRTLALDLAVFRANLQVEESGGLHASPETSADATIYLTPDVLARLPVQGKDALLNLRTEGDKELASALNGAFLQMDIDAEAELSRVFGPIIGFRLAEAGRSFRDWAKQATEDTARALAEYAVEESPVLANRVEVARFIQEVDQLKEDVSQLEGRLNRLTSSLTDDS